MKELSFVVTVYNKKDYIQTCVESLIIHADHNYTFEIIIIDDGSTDGSSKIIDDLCVQHPSIRAIHQENQGLSAARNNGISIAQGDYIWFIDADDTITKDCISKDCFYKCPDILVLQSSFTNSTETRNKVDLSITKGRDVLSDKHWCPCVPFYIFKRQFLLNNNLCFVKGIFHEDSEFTPRALYLAKLIRVIDKPLYIVSPAPGSITRTVGNYKRSKDVIIVARSLEKFINDHQLNSHDSTIFNTIISRTINSGLRNALKCSAKDQSDFNNLLSKNRHLLTAYWKSNSLKYKIEFVLFSIFKNYVKIYKLFK